MSRCVDWTLRFTIHLLAFLVVAPLGVRRAAAAEPDITNCHLIVSVEEGDSSVGFYDSRSGEEVGRVYLGHVKDTQREIRGRIERHRSYVGLWPHEIGLTADNHTAFVTHFGLKDYDELIGATGSTISVIDVWHMCEIRRLYTFGNNLSHENIETQFYKYRAPHGVQIQPQTNRLFVNVEANLDGENNHHMLVYDLSNGDNAPSAIWDIPENTHNFIFSKDGTSLWMFSGLDGVARFSLSTLGQFHTPKREAEFVREVTKNGGSPDSKSRLAVRGLTLTNDETQLIASGQGEMLVLDPQSLRLLDSIPVQDVKQFLYSSITTDGRFLIAPAVWEGKIVIIDLQKRKVIQSVLIGSDPVHVALAPDGQRAYVSHGRDNYISVIDISRLSDGRADEVSRIATHDGPNRLAVIEIPKVKRGADKLRPPRKRLRFGACLPLSGQNLVEGQDMRLGYQYWRDSVNSRGGLSIGGTNYEVELVLRDTQSLSKGAQANALLHKLTLEMLLDARANNEPIFFLGTYPTPPNIPSGAIATAARIPMVTAGAAGVVVYDPSANPLGYIFGVMSPARGFLNGTMDMLLGADNIVPKEEPLPTTGLFITSDDFGAFQDAVSTGKHVLEKHGKSFSIPANIDSDDLVGLTSFRIETVSADPELKTPQFTVVAYTHPETPSQIQILREEFPKLLALVNAKAEPEMLALTGHLPQAIDFVDAAAGVWPMNGPESSRYPKAIVLSVGPGNPEFTRTLQRRGISPATLIGASVWSPNQRQYGHDEFIDSLTFREKFEARFHKAPSYLAAGAVVCGLVYEEAFRRCGTIDPTKVRNALQSISDHPQNKLASGSIELFYSRIDFRDDENIRGLNDQRPLGTIQLQPNAEGRIEEVVLWPKSLSQAGVQLTYPFRGFPKITSGAAFTGGESGYDDWKH